MLFHLFTLHYVLRLFLFAAPVFEAQTIDANISIGYGIALGDVDGDGRTDILLADKKEFSWYRNGDWKKFVMVKDLTQSDNVCIAARDVNGDGKVEVAVGAQWNPGETSDTLKSGSVHYLIRPKDPTQLWEPVALHHEPTVHRMRWVKSGNGTFYLLVAPLHGRGNKGGEGVGVNILAYTMPADVKKEWPRVTVEHTMHMTHNFDLAENAGEKSGIYLAGKEGIRLVTVGSRTASESIPGLNLGTGEVRTGRLKNGNKLFAAIQPMHGDSLAVYTAKGNYQRTVIDPALKEGHALAVADFTGSGNDQVIAGWRLPNAEGKVGIKWYAVKDDNGAVWESGWVDDNGMACEDLQVADLNKDGKPDIVASGRASKNLKIYWNRSKN